VYDYKQDQEQHTDYFGWKFTHTKRDCSFSMMLFLSISKKICLFYH